MQDQNSKVFHELCGLVQSILRSPHLIPPSSSSSNGVSTTASSRRTTTVSSPSDSTATAQVSPAGFASLLLGVSLALMLCGSVTFVIGFILMPWVLGLVLVLYFAGIISNLSGLVYPVMASTGSPILDSIGDKGLDVVASSCKKLEELRVFPSLYGGNVNGSVTEEGLVVISTGCRKLHSLLYFCHQMTNAALITVAKNNPHFTYFRLCILDPNKPDHVTSQPLDEGFGAIVQACKNLKRLSLSGLLTDQVFLYIGMYGENLEMLSVAFAGESDKGMAYVLNGCRKLSKLEIRDSPFGDSALLADVGKYETMRSLWMSSCNVTLQGCKMLADEMKMLNVEIINEKDMMEEITDDKLRVEKMYLYRTLDGPRKDAPDFVSTL